MKLLIKKSNVSGLTTAPSSKSYAVRAVAAATAARGMSIIKNFSYSDDALSALSCASSLGAKPEFYGPDYMIYGGLRLVGNKMFCGESGSCARIFGAMAFLFDGKYSIDGGGTLKNRILDYPFDTFKNLGVEIMTLSGIPPITKKGALRSGKTTIDCSKTSQHLSGLLFALPLCKGDSELEVVNLRSGPYIDMTLDTLSKFGVIIERQENVFSIKGGQTYVPVEYEIENDWSGAAFILCAGAIAGEVAVAGLNVNSLQADKAILDVLRSAGAEIILDDPIVSRKSELRGFEFDSTESPDLFPPLVALACACESPSKIYGAKRLTHKESDRAVSLIEEFSLLGADLSLEDDALVVNPSKIEGGESNARGDHRIAMSLALLGLISKNGVVVDGMECVDKSYPAFFNDLKKIGATIV